MQIRPAKASDLELLAEIDGTVESTRYLHLEQSGEGLGLGWRLEERAMREKLIDANRMSDESAFALKQIVTGTDEGTALLAEHEGAAAALLLARPDPAVRTIHLVDLRVDYDFRRQGLGMALVYQLIQHARDERERSDVRAVSAATPTNNHPAAALLAKCGFDLSGVDTRRWSNHDLVKEAVTLFWYAALD